jgi:hypothetical protein
MKANESYFAFILLSFVCIEFPLRLCPRLLRDDGRRHDGAGSSARSGGDGVVEPYLGSPERSARDWPQRVDNVTLWVHPWSAASTGGRIREEIEADVSFAL